VEAPSSQPPSPHSTLVRVADVRSRELESGEIALLGSDEKQLILLNAVGAAVWDLCDGSLSQEAIIAELRAHFSKVPGEQIGADVKQFVERLVELQVLNRATLSGE
jgi:hypothetical protein